MRTMITYRVPAAAGNAAIDNGAIKSTVEGLMALGPEAAYFFADQGMRAGMVVLDMDDPAQIPQIAEPLFQGLEAEVDFKPVMNAEDLERALSSL